MISPLLGFLSPQHTKRKTAHQTPLANKPAQANHTLAACAHSCTEQVSHRSLFFVRVIEAVKARMSDIIQTSAVAGAKKKKAATATDTDGKGDMSSLAAQVNVSITGTGCARESQEGGRERRRNVRREDNEKKRDVANTSEEEWLDQWISEDLL